MSEKPRKKHPRKLSKIPEKKPGWLIAGFDVSMSSIAGAAIAWDNVTKKMKGPKFVMRRWSKDDDYFSRLKMASKSHELIHDLQAALVTTIPSEFVFIAQEEPFPPHGKFMAKGNSSFLKQQAEISGAFLGGLLRYGYQEIWQMSNVTWRQTVALMISEETGEPVTIHHSKWNSQKLAGRFNSNLKNSGKFRAKQWTHEVMEPFFAQAGWIDDEIPYWPDIIESSKDGKIPRPEGSKAKAVQSDDRYEALAMAWTLYLDLKERNQLP